MGIIIAIDIGGTQIRVATFKRGSIEPIDVRRTPTRSNDRTPFERVCEQIKAIWPQNETVDVIVLAAPGPLDPESGIIFSTPNIEGWENFPMRDNLQKAFNVPVLIGNDANLAALGEWYFGAAKGHHHVLYITISTGIGGGIISDDRLILGARGLAGEVGHVTVLPDGPVCGCGQRGHLEAVASGPSIVRYVQAQLAEGVASSLRDKLDLSARDVSEAASNGDALGIKALARAGDFLAQGLAIFLHLYNPSIVIFGGGVSFSGALLFDPMKASLEKHVMDKIYLKDLQITNAALGDDAGLLGALALGLVSEIDER
jgi:glucokinase